MKIKNILGLSTLVALLSLPAITTNASEKDLLKGVSFNYSRVSNIIGNIELTSKGTGELIRLPNGNYVKSVNNTNDDYDKYKINYQVSKLRDYSFVRENGNNKEVLGNVYVDSLKPTPIIIGKNKLKLKLNSEDFTSEVSKMRFSTDGVNWGEFIPFSKTHDFTIEDKDGEHTIFVQFKDNAGNITKETKLLTYLDKTPPKVDFKLNKGQQITKSKTLNIDLSITDKSDIKNIYVSEDNLHWKNFDGNLKNIKFDISNSCGEKTIFIKAEDIWGNMSKPTSKKIKFDNKAPTGSILINNGNSETNNNKVTIKADFKDDFSGIKSVTLKEGKKQVKLTQEQIKQGSISMPWMLDYGESQNIEMTIEDNAGNVFKKSSNTIKIVVTKLEISSFRLENNLKSTIFDISALFTKDKKSKDELKWIFPSQEMKPGNKFRFRLSYVKPNNVNDLSIDGNYNITIINNNGYSKSETIAFDKKNMDGDSFVAEYTLPKDAPVGSQVYLSSDIQSTFKLNGKAVTKKIVFPLENCQANIGHIIE